LGLENIKFPIFISRIYPKGKKIIFECRDLKGKIIHLVSLLAMTGRCQYTKGDHSGLELKLYKTDLNVFDAAYSRIKYVFDNYQDKNIFVNFSNYK
jgi:hypothetical protein